MRVACCDVYSTISLTISLSSHLISAAENNLPIFLHQPMMKVVWQTCFKRRLNLPNIDRAYLCKKDVRQLILVVKILGEIPWLKVKFVATKKPKNLRRAKILSCLQVLLFQQNLAYRQKNKPEQF